MPESQPSHPSKDRIVICVDDGAGDRIDRWLAKRLTEVSRTRIQALIAAGHVSVDGHAIDNPARHVIDSETIEMVIPEAVIATVAAQNIPLDVVFEDQYLIVINKPAGMVVHPGPGNPDRTLVNALLAHCGDSLQGIGGVARPGIVHRIDKDTSGLLVAAKTEAAHAGLSAQLSRHAMTRIYDAIVWGCPRPTRGTVVGAIGRSTHDRKKMAIVRSGGKSAETGYAVVAAFGTVAAHLECRLKTGRTHQIRVHLSSLGHGLIGDKTYGSPPARRSRVLGVSAASASNFPRQALHARVLGFIHPISNQEMHFEREMPDDMTELLCTLKAAIRRKG